MRRHTTSTHTRPRAYTHIVALALTLAALSASAQAEDRALDMTAAASDAASDAPAFTCGGAAPSASQRAPAAPTDEPTPDEATAPLPCPAPAYAMQRLKRVVIDPGHGGLNEGAIGHAQIHEKHLTLAVALHLADRLDACHPELEVILTRDADADLGLAERAALANAVGADLLISLHFNSATNPDARGHETFWLADTRPMLTPAQPAQVAIFGALADLPSRGERRLEAAATAAAFAQHLHAQAPTLLPESLDRGIKRANFAVLRHAQVPAVVVELGFLSHADEGLRLAQPAYQARWVQALIGALVATDGPTPRKASDLTAALPVASHL